MWCRYLSQGFIGLKPLNTDQHILELSKDVVGRTVVDVYVEHPIDPSPAVIEYLSAGEEVEAQSGCVQGVEHASGSEDDVIVDLEAETGPIVTTSEADAPETKDTEAGKESTGAGVEATEAEVEFGDKEKQGETVESGKGQATEGGYIASESDDESYEPSSDSSSDVSLDDIDYEED